MMPCAVSLSSSLAWHGKPAVISLIRGSLDKKIEIMYDRANLLI